MLDKWPMAISHHHWFLYLGSKLIQSFVVAKTYDNEDNGHFRLIWQRKASDSLHISSCEKAIFPPEVSIACVRDSDLKEKGRDSSPNPSFRDPRWARSKVHRTLWGEIESRRPGKRFSDMRYSKVLKSEGEEAEERRHYKERRNR